MIADGPAELPRVGWSVRIRNVPEGHCTYACRYCCRGGTERRRTRRRPFYGTAEVVAAARDRLTRTGGITRPAYLAFAPGGEPTLDAHLGVEIDRLSDAGLPIAVLTNASLLWRPDVQGALLAADLVVLKIDTVEPAVWQRLNRPAAQLRLVRILEGIRSFRSEFTGRLETVTSLFPGVNDDLSQLDALAVYLEVLAPARAFVLLRRNAPAASGPLARLQDRLGRGVLRWQVERTTRLRTRRRGFLGVYA